MAVYRYKARDKFGKLIEGVMEAQTESAITTKLTQMGSTPVSIQVKSKGNPAVRFLRRRGISFSDINMFTRLLYTLQKSGLPLLQGLQALQKQVAHHQMKDVIGQMARDVESGSKLSEALEKHPNVFDQIYVSMIKAGEISGKLSKTLERLAQMKEHDEMIRLRLKSALRYPLIVIIAIALGFTLVVTFVMPRFSSLYARFETALPVPTQILLGINHVILHYWWLILALIACIVLAWRKWVHTREGLLWWDSLKLNLPVFGPLILKLTMSRFSRVTGTLIHSGVPILQILDHVRNGVGNKKISNIIENIKKSVNQGKGMVDPMKASGIIPPIVIEMVATGEKTGKLDELLIHASDYYDSQVDYTINNLVSLVEPILILILGLIVLFLALGVFLPLWSLMDLFR